MNDFLQSQHYQLQIFVIIHKVHHQQVIYWFLSKVLWTMLVLRFPLKNLILLLIYIIFFYILLLLFLLTIITSCNCFSTFQNFTSCFDTIHKDSHNYYSKLIIYRIHYFLMHTFFYKIMKLFIYK